MDKGSTPFSRPHITKQTIIMLKTKNQMIAENPFYGKIALQTLANTGKVSKSNFEIITLLNSAWEECKAEKHLRAGFHTICFANSEISNRQHNAFGKAKKDDGGDAANFFYNIYLKWLLEKDKTQFVKFLPLFTEYVGFRELLEMKVKTKKNTSDVTEVTGIIKRVLKDAELKSAFLQFCKEIVLNGTYFQKHQLAKFTHIPRFSTRNKKNKVGKSLGRRALQPQTKDKMLVYKDFVESLSAQVGWDNDTYTGFKAWKRTFQQDIVDYMFSTKKILALDEQQFFDFLQASPAGQLYKIRRMLFDKDGNNKSETWAKLAIWFKKWEQSKLDAQKLFRELEAKAKSSELTAEEAQTLAVAKKEAKVNVGATSLFDCIQDLVMGRNDSDIVMENIVSKVKFDVPVLPIVDCSGSMTGMPTNIARLFTTLALLKNPHELGENLFLKFGSTTITVCDGSIGTQQSNRFVIGKEVAVEKIVDKTKSFRENYNSVKQFVKDDMGGTAFNNVAETMKLWVESNPDLKQQRTEVIQSYQVLMVISDGDFNGISNPVNTILDFKSKMKSFFGWDGVICIWDTPKSTVRESHFKNVDGVLHFTTFNMSTINQVFCNIHDLDVIDVYLPLKALCASNRYELVVANAL